jgi:hypothetical protein
VKAKNNNDPANEGAVYDHHSGCLTRVCAFGTSALKVPEYETVFGTPLTAWNTFGAS